MAKFGVGQPVRRVEDARLLMGKGQFTDDVALKGQAHAYILRSPHAHALIKAIRPSCCGVVTSTRAVLKT